MFPSLSKLPRPLAAAGCLLLAFALPAGLHAAEGAPAHGEDSPLHVAMESMGKAMRTLGKGLNSADPAATKIDTLAALQTMQGLAIEGKTLVPASFEKLPEAERPAQLAAYRADLAAAIITMLEIERAVLADKWDDAKAGFGRLRASRKDGHEKYNPEEESK